MFNWSVVDDVVGGGMPAPYAGASGYGQGYQATPHSGYTPYPQNNPASNTNYPGYTTAGYQQSGTIELGVVCAVNGLIKTIQL